jgi:dCMP deaminase
MSFCETLAYRSTCVRIQTAAIIVKNNIVISIGYNGCFSKAKHCIDYWRSEYSAKHSANVSWDTFISSEYFLTEHHKYSTKNELHGESNAIVNAAKNNISIEDSVIYTLYAPCINCAKLIISSGIKEVFYRHLYKRDLTGLDLLNEHNIKVAKI